MARLLILLYGVAAYSFGIGALTYFLFFAVGILVPVTVDTGTPVALSTALITNVSLVFLFALQHTIMARQGFKDFITRIVSKSIERATFVLISGVAFVVLMVFWQPITTNIWLVENPVLSSIIYAIAMLGWGLTFFSSFLINHFDLFGLRQVWLRWKNKPYTPAKMVTPFIYSLVRHPMMTGIIIGVWFTPNMTVGHFVLALCMTTYILAGIRFEERDLVREFGASYEHYRHNTPALFPRVIRKYRKIVTAE